MRSAIGWQLPPRCSPYRLLSVGDLRLLVGAFALLRKAQVVAATSSGSGNWPAFVLFLFLVGAHSTRAFNCCASVKQSGNVPCTLSSRRRFFLASELAVVPPPCRHTSGECCHPVCLSSADVVPHALRHSSGGRLRSFWFCMY